MTRTGSQKASRKKIKPSDLTGFKDLRGLAKLLEPLHQIGTQLDVAGNCQLHMDLVIKKNPDLKPTPEHFEKADKMFRLCEIAVQNAREESRRMGVPKTSLKDGKAYYELPDGTLSLEAPRVEPEDRQNAESGA